VKDATNYLTHIKALLVANPQVAGWKMLREEAQGELGLFRCRITLHDGSLLEMFERFQIVGEKTQITKYRFHRVGLRLAGCRGEIGKALG